MRIEATTPEPIDPEAPSLPLSRGARGAPVLAAQNQLLHAGFALPQYGADGRFGKETESALARFQRANGLPPSGRMDDATLRALEQAPSPSPDYDALFSDGVLRGLIAVGYDEDAWHEPQQALVQRGLAARGYTFVTDAQRANLGLDTAGTYLTRTLQRGDRQLPVVLELITPDTPNAKERFAYGLRNQELVLYGGHGRYGSGPDFDDIGSPAGNFVIGAPFEAGHVTLGPSDLAAAPVTLDYQLMFFDGCNTWRYLDELRTQAPGKTTKNLDVVSSTTELYWSSTAMNLMRVLDAVTDEDDLATLKEGLNEINRAGPEDGRDYFVGDGFEDNVRPR